MQHGAPQSPHPSVELSTLDRRYEQHRLRDGAAEARLLASIAQRGIEQPLQGVDTSEGRFLLDGFKRYRCAQKLGIDYAPYVSLAEEQASGILQLMRASPEKTLSVLEQAKFVVELLSVHQMNVAQVAQSLSRSKGWVSMRRSLLEEMSEPIQQMLFAGRFPVYSYMYTLRPFMRMNPARQQANPAQGGEPIERFMKALAGAVAEGGLSLRQIELLAHGYFRGPDSLRQAIDEGKWSWSLQQMEQVPQDREGCSSFEQSLLADLQSLHKGMQRLMTYSDDKRLKSRAFFAQAHLLTTGLLGKLPPFCERMKQFHDRSGQA